VSNKNLNRILSSSGLRLGRDEVDQKGLKQLYLWHHSEKTWNPKPKNFFHCRHKDLYRRDKVALRTTCIKMSNLRLSK